MCKKLIIVLTMSFCLISSVGAETVSWDFEKGNDHRFTLWCVSASVFAFDDPNIAGDESLTGVGGIAGLPDAGLAWTIGPPNQFDGLIPAVDEGCHVVNGVLEYGPCNDPFDVFDVQPPSYTNSRGQSGYLNTYNLSQWGDNLHIQQNDQIASSRRVLLGEEAKLKVWSLGGGSGTHAPEYDPDPTLMYTDGSSGIAVLSAEEDDKYALLASLHTSGHGTLTEDTLDLSAFAGKRVFIDVVDAFEGGWGWLAIDEIQITEKSRQAAMIVSDVNLPNGFDQAQHDRLESLGYSVTPVASGDVGTNFTIDDANALDLVLVSESIGSSAADPLIGTTTPVMHQEAYGWDNWLLITRTNTRWVDDINDVDIVNDTHPIATIAGLSVGPMTFFSSATSCTSELVSALAPGAVNLAQVTSDSNDFAIVFVIDQGAELVDGSASPNRIAGFSLPGQDLLAANVMTYDAWALWKATIQWLDPQVPPSVAHWTMDEGAGTLVADIVSGNYGTMVGLDPATAWIADGALGGAVRFDDIDGNHIEVPHSDAIDFGDEDFSVSLWIRYPEGVDPIGNIDRWIIKGTHGPPGSGSRYELFHKSDMDYSQRIRFVIDDGVFKSRIEVEPGPFITGDWVHVVAVRDTLNRQLLLYANGVKPDIVEGGDTGVDFSGDISSGEVMWIGESTDEPATAMMGDIDDVRIFDRALAADEIAMIYSYHGDDG